MTKPVPFRPAGDTATMIEFTRDESLGTGDYYAPPDEEDAETLRHGDVLKHSDSWRSTHVYIVAESADGSKKIVPLRFDSFDGVGDGYGTIGVNITRQIANPIEFYSDGEFDCYKMVAYIELDPVVHAGLLAETIGEGRSLKPECEVRWVETTDGFEARIPGGTDWEELVEPAISEFFV